jgi:hypothetical protein
VAFILRYDAAPASLRRVAPWIVVVAGTGTLLLAPGALASARRSPETVALSTRPLPPGDAPALVFVHGSWASRVVARLSAAGMRRDSVETALRRNDICAVDRYARWRTADASARDPSPPPVDLEALPGTPERLQRSLLSSGNPVWMEAGATVDEACTRDARADRNGALDLEPLLWQLPPLPGRDVVVARDMGPEINARALESLPSRRAFVHVSSPGRGEAPRLMEYDEGMELLWGAASRP